ncbi:hypothetical protein QZH41_019336, partial [Actinostola sp. cb2023]
MPFRGVGGQRTGFEIALLDTSRPVTLQSLGYGTKTVYHKRFFLHMGWGGSDNG